MRLDVYRNLNRGGLSGRAIDGPERGRVVARFRSVLIERPTFRIQAGSQARARREGVRNVHAFVRGACEPDADVEALLEHPDWTPLVYNPFRHDGFTAPDGRVIASADRAAVRGCRIAALNPRPAE